MATKTKIGNVEAAMAAATAQQAKAGGRVKLRATQVGYYGRPVADLIQPGTVFPMYVNDLEPKVATTEKASQIKDDAKRERLLQMLEERDTITHGGIVYLLPSWCEDAANAPAVVETAPPDGAPDQDDDVI